MFYWIYDYPTAKVGTLFAVVFVVTTWAATFARRRFLHPGFHRDRRANEMVGFVLSSYSVFYGILIGLIAVAALRNFGTVSDLVTKEASRLSALYCDLSGYPQPIRGRLQGDLREYTRSEVERDWPQQQRGIVPAERTHRLWQFTDDLLSTVLASVFQDFEASPQAGGVQKSVSQPARLSVGARHQRRALRAPALHTIRVHGETVAPMSMPSVPALL